MAWLIIQNDEDKFGLIPQPTHEHIPNYTKALKRFERLVKVENRWVKMLTDHEYRELYALDGEKAHGPRG